ncbi:MAG: ATPase, T2SS/T4P/T4SS family, partial [Oscillospiraceae bacterium]
TLEDPIEYFHRHNRSIIHQREIGSDTRSFSTALRAALRQDPDVLFIGEMRDLDSISTAITAAETGHLVFSTLHTIGAAKTIDRIIDVFPIGQQQQIRTQLSLVLQGTISQQLIPDASGKGRALAGEIMLTTPAVRNLIRDNHVAQISNAIITGTQHGMRTMDASLLELVRAKRITPEDAHAYSIFPEQLDPLLARMEGKK